MIIIADSGSTNTNWYCRASSGESKIVQTSGMNPLFRPLKDLQFDIQNELMPHLDSEVEKVYFYGAGVISSETKMEVVSALKEVFPKADIQAESDLMAAARGLFGHGKGLACILGTGANSCLYDKGELLQHVPPLGYALGDEGSGAWIGKRILADYLKGIMPPHLQMEFRQLYGSDYQWYIKQVYGGGMPGSFLAGFTKFASLYKEEQYIAGVLKEGFSSFVQRNIKLYRGFNKTEIGFVGSVAFVFMSELEDALQESGLGLSAVIREPLTQLAFYHQHGAE